MKITTNINKSQKSKEQKLTAQPNVKEAEMATKVLNRRSGVTDVPIISSAP